MKKILASVLAALLLTASGASAQIVFPSGNGVACPTAPVCTGPVISYPPGAVNFKTRNLEGATSVRNSKSTFYAIEVYNGSGATVYVQVFNAVGPGAVSLGTTTPDFEFPCATLTFCTGQLYLPNGISFLNGIVVGATTTEGGGTPIGTGLEAWVQYQ
jgi:hypothetical protein